MHKHFMNEAYKQAQQAFEENEVPVGAVIVHENKIIAKAYNQVETLKDPTAHAEMIAVTQAANFLSQKWLTNCSIYTTVEPCSMCAGALVLARIQKIYFAAKDPKTGACGSVVNIAHHNQLNHRIDIESGLLEEECSLIMSVFFQKKRSPSRLNLN